MAVPALSACFDRTSHRSADRFVESALGIKSWMARTPTCAEARPRTCSCCGAGAQPIGGSLVVVGHGVRLRQALGPVSFGGLPEALVVTLRRYRCLACRAVLVVGPRGLVGGRWYSGPAIALALAAVADGATSAAVRTRVSPAGKIGGSAVDRWMTVERWLDAARRGALFSVGALSERSRRGVAKRVTLVLAARGGHTGGAELGASAFVGAALAA